MKPLFQRLVGPLRDAAAALRDPQRGPLAAALIIISPDLRDEVGEILGSLPDQNAPHARWWVAAASTLEDPNVDDKVDDALEDPESAAFCMDALLRAGTQWHHRALATYVADPESGFAPSWMLSSTAPEKFSEVLEEIDDADALLCAFRAASFGGQPQLFETVLNWRAELEEDLDLSEQAQVDAALACLDPGRYARALLSGDVDRNWLSDDRCVADFLTIHAPTLWAETLAVFRTTRDPEAFELAALFATCSALTEVFDDVDDDDLDPADAPRWVFEEPSRVAFHLALGEEEDLATLLVEATLHQTLLERGIEPPPISGLPLSGGWTDETSLSEAISVLRNDDDAPSRVALIRTLTDLRRLVEEQLLSGEDARPVLSEFAAHKVPAAGQYVASFDDDQAFGDHQDWGCRGIHHITRQLRRPPEEALPALATALFLGPLERSPLIRDLFAVVVESLDD